MRPMITQGCLAVSLFAMLCVPSRGAMEAICRKDFAGEAARTLDANTQIVEDKAAAGGKAMMFTSNGGRTMPWVMAKGVRLAGPVTVVAHVRGRGFTGLTSGLSLSASFNAGDNSRGYEVPGAISGVQVSPDAYREVRWNALLDEVPTNWTFALNATWMQKDLKEPPVLWVDWVEVRANGAASPYISRVEPSQTAYRPGQKITVSATVVNPAAKAFTGSLTFDERWGLDAGGTAGSASVGLKPGEVRTFAARWKARPPEAGREVTVTLVDDRKAPLDAFTDFYGVAADPSFLNTLTGGKFTAPQSGRYNVSYVGPASYAQTLGFARQCKALRLQRFEYFSWSYNELASFQPPPDEEPYLGNEGIWWQSLKKFKTQVHLLKEAGISPITYINGGLWGPEAYKIYQRHPEWFLSVGSFNMESRAKYERRRELEFQQDKVPFFYCYLNPVLPEARRFVADQILRSAREMGWEGARWDVWNMNLSAGQRDLFGKEVAHTAEEADRLSAESIAAVKALVAKEMPTFTWGYNYGGPEEVAQTPLIFAEKCRGGGWILDEIICSYQEKTSPFHYWDAYRDRIVGWGDHVRQLGGIYNPYRFRRGGGLYRVDQVYESIFRLIGGGRQYGGGEFTMGAAGDMGLLAFRFSDVFFGWNLRLQPATQQVVRVDAPDTLWWRSMVLSNVSPAGRPQAIVHLVNSPMVREVEENAQSLVRAPVASSTVTCSAKNGKLPAKAWLLAAEPLTPGDEPGVRKVELSLTRVGDTASITVPSVLYWKTVVFEY